LSTEKLVGVKGPHRNFLCLQDEARVGSNPTPGATLALLGLLGTTFPKEIL